MKSIKREKDDEKEEKGRLNEIRKKWKMQAKRGGREERRNK